MRIHQGLRAGQENGLDDLAQEALAQRLQGRARQARQGFQGKTQKLEDVQGAGPVLIVEALVLALVAIRIHHPLARQEASPEVITVAGDEGVVQVENGQFH